MRSVPPAIALFPLVLLMTACELARYSTQTAPSIAYTHATYVYVCCSTSDVGSPWHRGQTVSLHWAAQPSTAVTVPAQDQASTSSIPLLIRAELRGPYATVAALKSQSRNAAARIITPNHSTDNWAGSSFSLDVPLPPDLPTGYYDLRTVETAPGFSNAGDAVITVAP